MPSKTCKLPIPYALMHPHTIRDAGFWTERWWHAGRSPSSLAQRTRRPWYPTRMSNLDSSDHRTLFHFETVHFKWALAHRTWRRFWTMFTYGFLSADGTADCVYRQWFLEVFLAHLVMSIAAFPPKLPGTICPRNFFFPRHVAVCGSIAV